MVVDHLLQLPLLLLLLLLPPLFTGQSTAAAGAASAIVYLRPGLHRVLLTGAASAVSVRLVLLPLSPSLMPRSTTQRGN